MMNQSTIPTIDEPEYDTDEWWTRVRYGRIYEPEYKMGTKGEPESFVDIVALLLKYSLARKTAAK